jgi:hypothetical protein
MLYQVGVLHHPSDEELRWYCVGDPVHESVKTLVEHTVTADM